jgi:plastocyanin
MYMFMGVVPVAPGATITVTNKDSVAHTLSGSGFDTGNLAPGQTKTITAPTKPGNYSFVCDYHSFMTGTLVVK